MANLNITIHDVKAGAPVPSYDPMVLLDARLARAAQFDEAVEGLVEAFGFGTAKVIHHDGTTHTTRTGK